MPDNCTTTTAGKIFSLTDRQRILNNKLLGPQNSSVAGLCKRHVCLSVCDTRGLCSNQQRYQRLVSSL